MNKKLVSPASRALALTLLFATATIDATADTKTIFDDAVTPAWQLSGWTGTQTIQSQFVKTGATAVKTDAQTWGALSFDSRDANWNWTDQPGNLYTKLSFDVSAGPTVGAAMTTLQVGLDVGFGLDAEIKDYVPNGTFAPGVWYHVEVSMAAINPQQQSFQKIAFQNNSESDLTFYIDNVMLSNDSTTTPPDPNPTPQPGALQSCAKIMPLGDSITAGTNGDYRSQLYTALQSENCGVSYVGTLGNDPLKHDGHGGYYIGDSPNNPDPATILNSVVGWLGPTQPKIVLLMAGTNDTAWWTNDTAQSHAAHHDALISLIQNNLPGVWIFAASIPPQRSRIIHLLPDGTTGDRAILAQQFNEAIKQNVQARAAAGQNVRFVDVYSALTIDDIEPDDGVNGTGVHPKDPAAYGKIANAFLTAIKAALHGTTPTPTPGPTSGFTLDIQTSQSRTPISPYIYGVNDLDPASRNVGAVRYGGNRFAAYNWENNYSNAGTDYNNSNDAFLINGNQQGSAPAGEVVRRVIANAHGAGAAALVTVPIGDWVAADTSGPVSTPAPNEHFLPNAARKPGARAYPPNLNDGAVYQDEFVAYLESQFAADRAQGKQLFYSLDNEPDLWPEKHPLLRGNPPTYASWTDIVSRATNYGSAIKDVAPSALTFGPVSYGYGGFAWFQGGARDPSYVPRDDDENKLGFLAYYLKQMKAAQDTAGRRLLDVLDVHWYSEARTPGDPGVRIVLDSGSTTATPEVIEARVQAPRSLWDPGYQEISWITRDGIGGPIRLIPRLRKIIADNYPGTKIAFTEYNHGHGNHISDAVAEADTLGIFGREGVYAAMFWRETGDSDEYTKAGIRMFRDYDGNGSTVGDTSVAASTTDVAKVAVYGVAHSETNNVVEVIVINRQTTDQALTVRLVNHPVAMSRADTYVLSGNDPTPRFTGQAPVSQNQLSYTAPALSVTTLVFRF